MLLLLKRSRPLAEEIKIEKGVSLYRHEVK
jgi:hypothetical protein